MIKKCEKIFTAPVGSAISEAYPVEKNSPSYKFMGFTSMFKKIGFTFVKKAGTRRNVMTYKL
ncbi:hypothetical protein LEP1GSC088_3118 [Leptospira interrogans str. L1207]|nr:hypothetical protein LEP1GSC088_3118 [Leptospira interrogans str. L1207]